MPVSSRTAEQMAPTGDDTPHCLRPYLFHGVELVVKGGHAVGDCPFCAKPGKFSVDCESGLWRCFVCGGGTETGGGNSLIFLRLLHQALSAVTSVEFYRAVATDRRLVYPNTAAAWGVVRAYDGSWVLPGYNNDGRLDQLYRRTRVQEKGKWLWRLLPTPGVWPEGRAHAIHLPSTGYNREHSNLIICEGPWDGMALWEAAELTDTNIIAVPGCNVWRDDWTQLCKNKNVTLLFDNDHPRNHSGKEWRAGYDGMCRIAKRLSGVASSVRWYLWGPTGHNAELPDGWDVRDEISGPSSTSPYSLPDRKETAVRILDSLEEVPTEIFRSSGGANKSHAASIDPLPCSTWAECESAWKEAMRWRASMSDGFAVLLAVCASTQQAGNQLFLDLIGSAGSGKTTMCEGLLVSHHCHHLEHLTGFHSGWKKEGEGDKDCSLIARVNGKTLITPEFDVLRSSPRYAEIMGQQRRIFDGKSGATYKNRDQDMLHVGLRTPWIRAGTWSMMDSDQSQLGDRFLRYIIDDPSEDEKRLIIRSALRSERTAMLETANGTAGSIVDPLTRKAYALTGGYVNWLRAHVEERLGLVGIPAVAEDHCIDLAELCADLRARPNEDKRKKENYDGKELPTRLARQSIRLAMHLAVVLNKEEIDADVMRIVRKVALDTAYGHSLNVVQWLCARNPRADGETYQTSGGLGPRTLEVWLGMNEERLLGYLMFLRKIDVLELRQSRLAGDSWVLTQRVYDLYRRINAYNGR